jgi:hypothetical protein
MHVEHELRECAMKPRKRTLQHGEACAGDLRGCVEVEQAQAGADIDVILHRKIERPRGSHASDFGIVLGGLARGHRRMRQVRYDLQKLGQLRLHVDELLLEAFELVRLRADLRHQRGRVFAFRLGLADLLRELIALRLQVLCLGLYRLTLALERFERGDIERVAALCEPLRRAGEITA